MAFVIQACKKCNKIFQCTFITALCTSCRDEEEENIKKVNMYIANKVDTDISEISETCEIEEDYIYKWLQDERVFPRADSTPHLKCCFCKEPIVSGKYCNKCKIQMQQNLKQLKNELEQSKLNKQYADPKMRFIKRGRL